MQRPPLSPRSTVSLGIVPPKGQRKSLPALLDTVSIRHLIRTVDLDGHRHTCGPPMQLLTCTASRHPGPPRAMPCPLVLGHLTRLPDHPTQID